MATVLTFSNQKGGVGKTTSVVNCAAYLACAGQRVVVVDNDPQGNASSTLGVQGATASIYSGQQPQPTPVPGLFLVAGGAAVLDDERRLIVQPGSRLALKRLVDELRPRFDWILIDCPPNLSFLPTSALLAADGLVVPLQCEYFALEGLGQLLAHCATLREEGAAVAELRGILLTMHDPKLPMARQVEQEVRTHFADRAFRQVVPRDPALAAAPSHGKTILDFDPLSPGGLAYLALAKELLHVPR